MTRILIRAGKSPFDAYSAHETFDTNLIGSNNGNLIFASATHKLLSAEGVSIGTRMFGWSEALAAKASDEYDMFVLPLANAFRPTFEGQLKKITQFIDKLTIPTVMLSGGAQSHNGSFDHLKPMEPTIKAFCKAVLRKSSHITVRGERSAEYIRSLGFTDVMVIGCPSLTTNGPGHTVPQLAEKDSYRIAYNIETSKDLLGELISEVERNHDATYFPQDLATMEMMLWGLDKQKPKRDQRLPLYSSHNQFASDKAEFFLDASTWIRRMKDFDFSFGPRIHGNIVPILAGTPSVVFAHDSRTQELVEYHEIPHFKPSEVKNVKSLDEVVERADFTKFNAGHSARVNKVKWFLNENGIKTIFDEGEEKARASYEASLTEVALPPAQGTDWASMSVNERYRLSHQRTQAIEVRKLKAENQKLRDALSKASSSLATV
ncbi:polysaccharide pyruvyl transferase family protein [Glutamicibacter sp. NPDC087344]|uniref:polysaccharide pyruvyl transferase family protein n=1 Tax=Glutamicibacter sp. NPDC087344 TaxID=3363994 RepID=UPI003803A5BF